MQGRRARLGALSTAMQTKQPHLLLPDLFSLLLRGLHSQKGRRMNRRSQKGSDHERERRKKAEVFAALVPSSPESSLEARPRTPVLCYSCRIDRGGSSVYVQKYVCYLLVPSGHVPAPPNLSV